MTMASESDNRPRNVLVATRGNRSADRRLELALVLALPLRSKPLLGGRRLQVIALRDLVATFRGERARRSRRKRRGETVARSAIIDVLQEQDVRLTDRVRRIVLEDGRPRF